MSRRWSRGRAASLRTIAALAVVLTAGSGASGRKGRLGAFDGDGDLGSPKIAGSAAYNGVSQEYALAAGGANMWAVRDEFHFAWKRMTGDFILQARVELLGQGVDPHRKAGWMVRPSQDADAPYVDGVVHGDGLTSLQFRRTKGAVAAQTELAVKAADVIQLERKGGSYIFSAAKYGEPFATAGIADVSLGDEVLVGLVLCSHNADVTERAVFRDVRIIRPAKDTFVPYRDFIGTSSRSSMSRADIDRSSTAPSSPSRRPTGQPTAAPSSTTNWFPHISPDGQWIAMISFPKEVTPTDHPYYKRVYLRLMPTAGGAPKVIAYVYGGQGTMNVP